MNIEDNAMVELAVSIAGGLAAAGWIIIRLATRGLEQQHDATRKLIEERFQWAEAQRQDARAHWEDHFDELRRDDDQLSERIGKIETRVAAIEIHLYKNSGG